MLWQEAIRDTDGWPRFNLSVSVSQSFCLSLSLLLLKNDRSVVYNVKITSYPLPEEIVQCCVINLKRRGYVKRRNVVFLLRGNLG